MGVTTESAASRLYKHNNSIYGNHFTSKANDWQLMLEISCENLSEARKIELYIKRMKSGVVDSSNASEPQVPGSSPGGPTKVTKQTKEFRLPRTD